MNNIIRGRTNPNIRHLLKGILLCEMLNTHLARKKTSDLFRRKMWEAEHIYNDSVYEVYLISDDDEETQLIKNKK